MIITVPVWREIREDSTDPLEKFVLDNEPAVRDKVWREQLQALIDHVVLVTRWIGFDSTYTKSRVEDLLEYEAEYRKAVEKAARHIWFSIRHCRGDPSRPVIQSPDFFMIGGKT